jgi:protein O-mannosyl-transferase
MAPSSSLTRSRCLALAALAFATLALYAPVAGHPFIHFDDNRYLTENPVTQGGLSWAGLAWAFTTLHASNWHPLTWLSHMLDVQLFGMNPGAHHLANAAWHAVNAALLAVALNRLTGAFGRSLVVAALFAVHPLHVESVAWVAERKDLLSTFFGLLALLAYARHAERPSRGRLALVGLAFAASLLAKPMWVTLPFLLLLLDVWPLRRLERVPLGRLVAEKLPLLALSVASSAVTVVAQGRGNAITGLELGLGARLGNALVAYASYLGKTFWPADLAIFYPHAEGELAAATVLVSALMLLAATALAVAQLRRRPWVALGWFWFLGTLVPVIGLVQVGAQAMADRYTYLPIIGIFIAMVWSAWELFGALASGWPARAAAVAVLLALSGVTWHQLDFWKDHLTLFRHALVAGGESGLVHAVISEGLRSEGRVEEALAEAQQAVRLAPGTAKHWNNLGVSWRDVRRLDEARQAFQESVRLEPGYAMAWVNLSDVELLLGHRSEAAQAALQATRAAPGDAAGWHRLAQVRGESGDIAGAIESDREAVRLKPDYGSAWTSLAIAYQAAGRIAEATGAFVKVTEVEPAGFVGWRNLGVHLAKQGQLAEAERAFTAACRLRPGEPDLLHRLGLIQAALGDRAGVLQTASRLEPLDPARAADLRARVEGSPSSPFDAGPKR